MIRGSTRGLGSNLSFSKQADLLENQTRSVAESLIKNKSKSQRGPVLTGVLDKKTGDIFYGINSKLEVSNLHPILQKRLDALKQRTGGKGNRPDYVNEIPGSHSEISAVNEALKAREAAGATITEDVLGDFILHNKAIKGSGKGDFAPPRCPDCNELTKGVRVVGSE